MEDNGCCSTSVNVLMCPMDPTTNDAGAHTVAQYLLKLAAEVWKEGECFSGKRPFGNSSWEHEVYTALAKAGILPGTFDEDGYLEEFDHRAADALVAKALEQWIGKSAPPARQS